MLLPNSTAPSGHLELRQEFSLTHRRCRARYIQPHHSPSRKAPKKITSAGNSFTLVDAPGVTLGVSGPLSAAEDVVLSTSGTGAITASGSIGAGSLLSVASGSGGISLGAGAALTGVIVELNGAAGGIALTGNASVGQIGGVVDFTTTGGGVTEASTATVTAGTLLSTVGITGHVAMAGASNAIANIGSLTVSGGSVLLVLVGTVADLPQAMNEDRACQAVA